MSYKAGHGARARSQATVARSALCAARYLSSLQHPWSHLRTFWSLLAPEIQFAMVETPFSSCCEFLQSPTSACNAQHGEVVHHSQHSTGSTVIADFPRLQAASWRPTTNLCMHFCAAAHAARPPDLVWLARAHRATHLLPKPFLSASPFHRNFSFHVRFKSLVAL
jgi:hypothetical protein